MAEEIEFSFSDDGLYGGHIERLAKITECEFIFLHGFKSLPGKAKSDFVLGNLICSKVCSAKRPCFTTI